MSAFLDVLRDKLTALEQELQNLPGELDSIVTHLNQSKWANLLQRLNHDFNTLLDELMVPKSGGALLLPGIMTLQPLEIRGFSQKATVMDMTS